MIGDNDEWNMAERTEKILLRFSVVSSNPDHEAIKTLRAAYQIAVSSVQNFTSEKPLDDARNEVGLKFPHLIAALEDGALTQEIIDKAKRATTNWKSQLALAQGR